MSCTSRRQLANLRHNISATFHTREQNLLRQAGLRHRDAAAGAPRRAAVRAAGVRRERQRRRRTALALRLALPALCRHGARRHAERVAENAASVPRGAAHDARPGHAARYPAWRRIRASGSECASCLGDGMDDRCNDFG